VRRSRRTHPARVLLQRGNKGTAGRISRVFRSCSINNFGRIPQVHRPVHKAACYQAKLRRSDVSRREAARRAADRRTGSSPVSVPPGLQASLWKRSLVATAPPASGMSRLAESARSTLKTWPA
jgi:hypothetical protein